MFIVRGFCPSAVDWVNASGRGQVHLVVPASRVQCPTPLAGIGTKLIRLSNYVTPAAHVTRLPDACCIGDEGAIVTSDGLLLTSTIQRFSIPISASAAWEHRLSPDQERKFDGVLGVLGHHGPRTFCHVLADALPRIWLVRRAGIEPDGWAVPARLPSWFSELLDRAGIPEGRRVYVSSTGTISARELIVPDRSGFAVATAGWARTALLELFGLSDSSGKQDERIWISRELAARRRWTQEKDAWPALEDRGFAICQFEDQPIESQYQRILSSHVIAGPHGAGLAWGLAARQPRGLLFEVADVKVVHNDYCSVAAIAGWDYARTSHADVGMSDGDEYLSDLDIDPNEVIRQLDIILAKWQTKL